MFCSPQILCYADDVPQDVTNAHLVSPDATGVPSDTGAPEVPTLTDAERVSFLRAELRETEQKLQASLETNVTLVRENQELAAFVDVTRLPMSEKERRFQEDPESLGIPKKTTPQADPQSSPKTRHVTEEEMRGMTLEEKMALNPRSLKKYRPY